MVPITCAECRPVPQAISSTLFAAAKHAVSDPATVKQMEAQGADPDASGPEAFRRLIAAEYKRFGEAVKIADLKPE